MIKYFKKLYNSLTPQIILDKKKLRKECRRLMYYYSSLRIDYFSLHREFSKLIHTTENTDDIINFCKLGKKISMNGDFVNINYHTCVSLDNKLDKFFIKKKELKEIESGYKSLHDLHIKFEELYREYETTFDKIKEKNKKPPLIIVSKEDPYGEENWNDI